MSSPLWAISTAILLPLLIYLLISAGIGYRGQRSAIEAATMHRAAEIASDVDGRLDEVAAVMRVLATIRSIREENWREAQSRSREIAALDPDWRDVALIDLDRGTLLFGLTTPNRDRPVDIAPLRAVAAYASPRPIFSGIRRNRAGQTEIRGYYALTGMDGRRFLMSVAISPDMIQRILAAAAPREGVSAVVDRSGRFIGRSLAYEERVGGYATQYLRDAIRQGRSGVYRGVTWEGLENYTGFMTSGRTGWSAHVAVSSAILDSPERRWLFTSGLAALVSLFLGFVLAGLTLRSLRRERGADDRVRKIERLETAGQLIGGVAHDFNNMLAIIQGSLDLALRKLARGDADVGRHLDNAVDGTQRAADLTRRLLAFSRRQALSPVPVDANAVIRGMHELLARTLSADVTLDLKLDDALHTVLVDPTLLENAIVNLAVNARGAMPSGGTLAIETHNLTLDAKVTPYPPSSGDYVCIAVRDTGTGMTAEVLAKAFEPFFTTKPAGKGTGLGLAQVHGFVTQSGGVVDVSSTLGDGTTFRLCLPAHRGPAVSPVRLPAQAMPRALAGETILLAEDEDRLRQTGAEALRELGYTVFEASTGAEALDLLGREPRIMLLLTDIVMPGMSGMDLARQARGRLPHIRILYVTGFERDAEDGEELLGGVLRKPFSIDTLARRVRAVMDRPG